jgi:hypothetical protein
VPGHGDRVFDARGQLLKIPQRRPRRRWRRFQRDRVNELWQFDGFDYDLANGTPATVLRLTDDCSRTDLALDAARSDNGEDIRGPPSATPVARYGLPVAVLNDNASAFSGLRRGWTSTFEQRLADLGSGDRLTRGSPQTCGKNERAHQRVQKWLDRRPPARDLPELQDLLDRYREAFNNRRNRVRCARRRLRVGQPSGRNRARISRERSGTTPDWNVDLRRVNHSTEQVAAQPPFGQRLAASGVRKRILERGRVLTDSTYLNTSIGSFGLFEVRRGAGVDPRRSSRE